MRGVACGVAWDGVTGRMKRFILTGTPSSGKTTVLRALEARGYAVIEEAATDVIAMQQAANVSQPWKQPEFIDAIVTLQKQRQQEMCTIKSDLQFYDRSPMCSYALGQYLGVPPSVMLMQEIERIQREEIYQRQVFFIENLGFVEPTHARKISFEDALIFERIHRETYEFFGYTCFSIMPACIDERVEAILNHI